MVEQLETPALLLDEARMNLNIERMRYRVWQLGVSFRPFQDEQVLRCDAPYEERGCGSMAEC
ncbi:hypothetical protein [Cupriavidus sp. D39]|uniref:hypothetical protein n=1 Tax=Cupriavidus sp. D39 TaxID=2997877 RepID=UPI00226D8638|nr:hypothetical protein [Cupriavidus sp. D39]MCY0854808.1 hypothetical protein [Cupriavidus sp. D39]